MRPLLFGLALALTVFAFIPFSLAQEGQRLKPAELGQLQAKAQAGDPVAMRALGDAYRDGNGTPANLDLALSWYERAAAAGNSTALYNMGVLLSERGRDGDLPRALDVLNQVLPAYEESLGAGHVRVGNIHMVLGRIYSDRGRYEEALAADGKALAIFEKELGIDSFEVAKIASNMGIVYERLGRYDAALQSYNRSLAILSQGRGASAPALANLYVNLGIVYESLGRLDDALAAEQKALRIRSRESGADDPETALVLANMGSTLDRLGRPEEAVKAYEKALPILAGAYGGDHPLVAVNLANLGTVYASVGRYDESLKALNTALPALIKGYGPDHPSVAYAYYNSGLVYQTLSQFDAALASFQKTLPLFEKIYGPDHAEIAQVRAAIGNVYSEMERDAEALPELEKALPILEKAFGDHQRVATVYNNLGASLDGLGRYNEALTAYDKAIAIKMKLNGPADPDIAIDDVNKANIYESLGRLDEAIAETLQALAIYAGSGEARLDPIRKAYWAMARALDKSGDRRAAILFAKLAVNAHQELRLKNEKLPADLRSSLAHGLRWVYQLLGDQQIVDGAFAEAQYASSLIKEEELFDFTARGSSGGLRPHGEVRLTKSEAKLLNDVNRLLKTPHRVAAELQSLSERRRRAGSLSDKDRFAALSSDLDAAYETLARDAKALFTGAEENRRTIQAEQLALNRQQSADLQKQLINIGKPVILYQAISVDDALHLFVSYPGRETIHREVSVKRADLAQKVYAAISAVESRDPDAQKKLAELYELLVRPVEKDLAAGDTKVVMLNLSGFLRYVPFAALYSGKDYLIEDYALALYTPAAGTKFVARPKQNATGAGFGVSIEHANFPALPGVVKELEAIFTGADGRGELSGRPVLDQAFDEASLKTALRKKPQFVHVASHFKFVPGNENNSFLLLGTGSELTLNRMRTDKDLRFAGVDLLTLSACETARGGGAEGEEIESMGALAQLNGASAVMATLWQIADDSTATLMSGFYAGMVRDGLDKATALQRAQVAMLKSVPLIAVAARGERAATIIGEDDSKAPTAVGGTAHPYYWAPFILMGNWL